MSDALPSVLITGTSTGMGHVTAKYLAENGFRVYAGVRNEDDARLWNGVERVTPIIVDVAKQDTIQQAFDRISGDDKFFGLVNNAAIIAFSEILTQSRSSLQRVFDVNLFGPISMINTFYPLLERNAGRIINISSINGFVPSARDGGYSMTKHAMEALTEQLRFEISPECSISVVQPGLYKTAILKKGMKQADELISNGKDWGQGIIDFYSNEENSRDPIIIAQTVHHILTVDKPKIRYVVGAVHEEDWTINSLANRLVNSSYSNPRSIDDLKEALDQQIAPEES